MFLKKKMFYWLWWHEPVRGALVEAKITKPNEIDIELGGNDRDGFRVFLDDALVDLDKEVVIREGGEEVFRGKVQRTLTSLLLCAGEKYDTKMLFPAHVDLKDTDE